MDRSDRIGRGLKLKDLHTFRAVVERGSMAKAADDLALTPSAITKIIGDMETVLGVSLLDRTPQGVAPTIYGEALLEGSVNVFDELKQTVARIASLADPGVGEVRIGASETWMGTLLPKALDRLTRQYSGLVFRVGHANAPAELYSQLRARSIDVLIARTHTEPEEDIEKEALFDDPLVVVTGRENPKFRGRDVKLAQLVEEPWCVAVEPHVVGVLLAQAFRASGLPLPNVRVSCASMVLQSALVETGRYLTVMPTSYLRFRSDKESLRILPVELNVRAPPISIATLKHRRVSPAARLFIDTLRAVAKEME